MSTKNRRRKNKASDQGVSDRLRNNWVILITWHPAKRVTQLFNQGRQYLDSQGYVLGAKILL